MNKLKEEIKKLDKTSIFLIGILIGLAIIPSVFIFLSLISQSNTTPYAPLQQKGIFYGQVVDALTLNPLSNATVKFFESKRYESLLVTLYTNSSGMYQTPFIVEPEYAIVEHEGYYPLPLEYSYVRTTETSKNNFYIDPIQLYRKSNNFNVYAFAQDGRAITDKTTINITVSQWYHSSSIFVIVENLDNMASFGSQYYGNTLYIRTGNNIKSEESSIRIKSLFYITGMDIGQAFHLDLALGNYTETIKITFMEILYPKEYLIQNYNYKSITFQIKVTYYPYGGN